MGCRWWGESIREAGWRLHISGLEEASWSKGGQDACPLSSVPLTWEAPKASCGGVRRLGGAENCFPVSQRAATPPEVQRPVGEQRAFLPGPLGPVSPLPRFCGRRGHLLKAGLWACSLGCPGTERRRRWQLTRPHCPGMQYTDLSPASPGRTGRCRRRPGSGLRTPAHIQEGSLRRLPECPG